MYKRGRGGVVEEKCETTEVIWKHELRLHRNKIEEVEWRNRSLAAPNPIVPSLSDRPRDDGGREGCFPHPSPWCPVILPLWIISVGITAKRSSYFRAQFWNGDCYRPNEVFLHKVKEMYLPVCLVRSAVRNQVYSSTNNFVVSDDQSERLVSKKATDIGIL